MRNLFVWIVMLSTYRNPSDQDIDESGEQHSVRRLIFRYSSTLEHSSRVVKHLNGKLKIVRTF